MPIGRATVLLWLIAGLLMIPSAEVCAKDLIAVSVDGVPRTSGSSFIDLVDDALSQVGAFQNLSGLASYTLSFDYLGIPGAIVFDAHKGVGLAWITAGSVIGAFLIALIIMGPFFGLIGLLILGFSVYTAVQRVR